MSPRLAADRFRRGAAGGLISSGVYFDFQTFYDVKGRFYAVSAFRRGAGRDDLRGMISGAGCFRIADRNAATVGDVSRAMSDGDGLRA